MFPPTPMVLKETVSRGWARNFHLAKTTSPDCLIHLPFQDGDGDPVAISLQYSDGTVTIDDAGAAAGLLFSLGEHNEEDRGFQFVQTLTQAHELEIDFDEGLLRTQAAFEDLPDAASDFVKVALTLLTALPHLRSAPREAQDPARPVLTRLLAAVKDLSTGPVFCSCPHGIGHPLISDHSRACKEARAAIDETERFLSDSPAQNPG